MMRMKNFFKNNKTTLATVAFILVLTAIFTVSISAKDRLIGENPIEGIDDSRSHVLVKGQDYQLNYEQEQEYKEEQQQKSEEIKEEQKNKSRTTIAEILGGGGTDGPGGAENGNGQGEGTNTGGGSGGGTGGGGTNTGGNEDESKLPTIVTDLEDGQNTAGTMLTFTVEGFDYKGYKIDGFYYNVTVNGVKTYSSGSTYKRTYRTDITDGANTVVITVSDKDGNTASKTFTINCDENGDREKGGTVYITIEARTVGLGYIVDHAAGEFYKGENIPYVIQRTLEANGIAAEGKTNPNFGWYLARLRKAGITNGASIPSAIQEKLDEEGATSEGYEADSLGEFDFYQYSGWVYLYNGEFLQTGMSNVTLCDGDDITIAFTTNMGYEYDGTWFYGSW